MLENATLVTELMNNSHSTNTVTCYTENYSTWLAWLERQNVAQADDETVARFLAERYDAGQAPSTISLVIAAINWHHRERGDASPVGETSRRVMRGIKRKAGDRGRGQSDGLTWQDYERLMTSVDAPIEYSCRVEKPERAERRAELDRVILSFLFMGAMRRSEVAAVTWDDIEFGDDELIYVEVRKSKTNQNGERGDVRVVKGIGADALKALRTRRADECSSQRIVPLGGKTINVRFQRMCKNAGLEGKYTSHSGRIGLASELSARGAPITAIAKAGGWKSADTVIHYARKAKREKSAVAQYL